MRIWPWQECAAAADEIKGNYLECLDDDSGNDDEDEADESVPDKGGDPIGDRTHWQATLDLQSSGSLQLEKNSGWQLIDN